MIEVDPDAEAKARALDAERAADRVRGPLHGIPIVVKDCIATADRMQTTAGSLALVGSKVAGDAGVVTRLREAGALCRQGEHVRVERLPRLAAPRWVVGAGRDRAQPLRARVQHG